MKNSPHSSRPLAKTSGFTLVELLTVIAIIAILMGLLFPTMGAVMNNARKVEAKADATNIVTAIKAYYTEYGKYPVATPSTSQTADTNYYDDSKIKELFNMLRAIDGPGNAAHAMNPRRIVFIEGKSAKNTAAAQAKSGFDSDGAWHDPWGVMYKVRIDDNYDNGVTNPYTTNASPAGTIPTGAIAWSTGIKKDGAAASEGAADQKKAVVSWQ